MEDLHATQHPPWGPGELPSRFAFCPSTPFSLSVYGKQQQNDDTKRFHRHFITAVFNFPSCVAGRRRRRSCYRRRGQGAVNYRWYLNISALQYSQKYHLNNPLFSIKIPNSKMAVDWFLTCRSYLAIQAAAANLLPHKSLFSTSLFSDLQQQHNFPHPHYCPPLLCFLRTLLPCPRCSMNPTHSSVLIAIAPVFNLMEHYIHQASLWQLN